jgi:hypothetical protein
MERYLKRIKVVPIPPVYRDIWTLIAAQLEWPELYALTRTCKQCKAAAEPFLVKLYPSLKRDMLSMMKHIRDTNIFCVWQFMQGLPLKTRKSPFLSTHRANFFGLVKLAFHYRWGCNWAAAERELNQEAARFCRISSDNAKIGPRPASWRN